MIYEVTVNLPKHAREQALEYMRSKHIEHVLEHAAFSHAILFVSKSSEAHFSFTTHYYVKDAARFEDYLESESEPYKADFMESLGSYAPKVDRRLIETGQHFEPSN